MKIAYFDPVSPKCFDESFVETIKRAKTPETEVHLINLNFDEFQHIDDLEYEFTNAFVITETLNAVFLAEKEGFDAFIIGCFLDPGLQAAREISKSMLVIGACEASVSLAGKFTHSFSVLLNDTKIEEEVSKNISNYGLNKHLNSFEYLGVDMHELAHDVEHSFQQLKKVTKNALQKNTEALIIGCTVGNLYLKMLQEEFKIPVIDPIISSILSAENTVRAKETMQLTYPRLHSLKSPSEDLIKSLLRPNYQFKNRLIIK